MSAPEAEAHDILTEAGLVDFVWNADLFAPDGTFIARPDAYDPTVGLALEVESREYHSDGVQLERTLQRNARLAAYGVLVIGVSPYRLRRDPDGVLLEIRAAQAALALRPTPRLTVRGHDGRLIRRA
jgi:hypothetical protein